MLRICHRYKLSEQLVQQVEEHCQSSLLEVQLPARLKWRCFVDEALPMVRHVVRYVK